MTLFDKADTSHTEPSASLISPLKETNHNEQGWNPDCSFPPSLSIYLMHFHHTTSVPSLTPVHHTHPSPHTHLPFPLPCMTSLTWQTAHLGLIQQSQMPASFLFGSHSSAPLRSHSHLVCLLEIGLSEIPSLSFPTGIIENGIARANLKKAKKEKCHTVSSLFTYHAFDIFSKWDPASNISRWTHLLNITDQSVLCVNQRAFGSFTFHSLKTAVCPKMFLIFLNFYSLTYLRSSFMQRKSTR